jgi:hypothetical protein
LALHKIEVRTRAKFFKMQQQSCDRRFFIVWLICQVADQQEFDFI